LCMQSFLCGLTHENQSRINLKWTPKSTAWLNKCDT